MVGSDSSIRIWRQASRQRFNCSSFKSFMALLLNNTVKMLNVIVKNREI